MRYRQASIPGQGANSGIFIKLRRLGPIVIMQMSSTSKEGRVAAQHFTDF